MNDPTYAQLAARTDAPAGSSWGTWRDQQLGALNRLGPESARRGREAVRSGTVFPLDLALGVIDPPLFGRSQPRQEVVRYPSGAQDDLLHGWNTQCSSQWDGFRHMPHPTHGFYGGLPDDQHGVGHWAARGIATRGIVIDIGPWRAEHGRPLRQDRRDTIGADDLRACLSDQEVEPLPGDVLLICTGWVSWYRLLDRSARQALATTPTRELTFAGLAPEVSTAEFLWDSGVAAVASDSPALEAWPPDPNGIYLHHLLLPMLGLPIGELWDLENLADDCRRSRTWGCFLTSAPLPVPGGVGSPANALAVR